VVVRTPLETKILRIFLPFGGHFFASSLLAPFFPRTLFSLKDFDLLERLASDLRTVPIDSLKKFALGFL